MGNNISGEGADKEVFQSYRIPPKAYKKKSSSKSGSGSSSTPSAPGSPSSGEFKSPPSFRSEGQQKESQPLNAALAAGSPTPSLYGPVSAPLPMFNGNDSADISGSTTSFSIGSDSFDPSNSIGSGLGRATIVNGKVVEAGFHGSNEANGGTPVSANSPALYHLNTNNTVQDFISYQQQQQQQFLEQQQYEYKQMLMLQQKQQHLRQQYQQQQHLLLQQQHQLHQHLQMQPEFSSSQEITGTSLQNKTQRPVRHPDRVESSSVSDSGIGSSPKGKKMSSVSLDDLAAKILPSRRMLGGREYYPDKTLPYLLPCDEQESERLLLQHYVIRYAFGSNIIPPIDTSIAGKVIDCGCGPGTWVMEMATEYPELDFYGFDISPMFPSAIHPKNAHFAVGNLLSPDIPFSSDSYVLINQRNMLLGLTQEAWPSVVQDLFRCALPGQGWIQLSEVDPIWARPGPVSRSFLKKLNETAQNRNVDVMLPQRLDQVLKEVGCENVKMMMVEIPIGPWGGKIGVLWRDVLKAVERK
ncbi:hypothetical protein BGZ65_006972 [Modicella reniformis]|uniref:S-adenosyl-L-methionine-dependent methyltransferase n=1 Tax=Modicella reniformis TaxID=1440133 RepID=A0A9P6MFG8_9FUNG|nr:hypothetical protein BGZ65_006972 [Modicella reniformis]